MRVSIKVGNLGEDAILKAALASPQLKSRVEAEVARNKLISQAVDHYESYARQAVNEIDEYLSSGVAGGSSSLRRLFVSTPGRPAWVRLTPKWRRLSEGYIDEKGHDLFWSLSGLVSSQFRQNVVSGYTRSKFTSYSTRITRQRSRNGFQVTLAVELRRLPSPYDELVRRPFLAGVQGKGLPEAPAFVGAGRAARQSVSRVLLPENQRPLLRPIAYRMGRLALKNFRKTLEL